MPDTRRSANQLLQGGQKNLNTHADSQCSVRQLTNVAFQTVSYGKHNFRHTVATAKYANYATRTYNCALPNFMTHSLFIILYSLYIFL